MSNALEDVGVAYDGVIWVCGAHPGSGRGCGQWRLHT